MRGDGHDVVLDTGDLSEQGPDVLGSLGNLDVQELLHGEREALLVGHHGDVIETVKVRQRLQVRPVLDQLLGAAVQQSDVGVGTHDLLAVELQNQPQHTVGGWMLGPEIDRVVSDLLARDVGVVVVGAQDSLAVGIDRAREVGIGRNELRALLMLHIGVVAWARGREGAGKGLESRCAASNGRSGRLAQAFGGVAGASRQRDGHCGRSRPAMPFCDVNGWAEGAWR